MSKKYKNLYLFRFIPIVIFWVGNILLSQCTFAAKTNTIPIWLISFITLFIPVCLTTKIMKRATSRKKMIALQVPIQRSLTYNGKLQCTFIKFVSVNLGKKSEGGILKYTYVLKNVLNWGNRAYYCICLVSIWWRQYCSGYVIWIMVLYVAVS